MPGQRTQSSSESVPVSGQANSHQNTSPNNASSTISNTTLPNQNTNDNSPVNSNDQVTVTPKMEHETVRNLPRHEQKMLAKIHKNLGHPNPEQMSTLMLQQGFRPDMVQAARHFQCGTCIQNSQPKHARPSSFKDDLDFNDQVSMDGVKW